MLYAKRAHAVTFQTNGGSAVPSVVADGEIDLTQYVSEKEGYTFVGCGSTVSVGLGGAMLGLAAVFLRKKRR